MLLSFPVAMADMLCGSLAFTGAGPASGLEAYAIDVRHRVAPAAPASAAAVAHASKQPSAAPAAAAPASIDAPPLPPVPFAPRASAGASAAGGRRGLVSSVVAGASSMAGVATGGGGGTDTTGAVQPSWAGTVTPASAATVVGSLAIAGAAGAHGGSVSALALDGDLLGVGFTDGSVRVWRVAGVEGAAMLTSWPSLRARPDAVLSGAAAGPVLSLAVSRDDDLLVAGYAQEAWVYEVARARPLQVLRLGPPGAFDPALAALLPGPGCAGAGVSPSLCTSACIVAGGGVLVAVSALVSRDGARAWVSDLLLYGPGLGAAAASGGGSGDAPVAAVSVPARITCLLRVRANGSGDWEGAGAGVIVGRSDGVVALLDARGLRPLVAWETPGRVAVASVDLSPCCSFLVAGCAQGVLAVFALPALPVAVALDADAESDASVLESLVSGVAALGSAALTQVDSARGVAKAAKAIAGEASSVVRGLLGSLWGGGGGSASAKPGGPPR